MNLTSNYIYIYINEPLLFNHKGTENIDKELFKP